MRTSARPSGENSAARLTLLATFLVGSLTHAGEVYKCVDAAGKVTYADAPCSTDAAKVPILLSPEEAAKLERKARNEALSDKYRKEIAENAAKRAASDAAADAKAKAERDRDRERDRADALANSWGMAEQSCAAAIEEKMRYLEPVGPYSHLGKGLLQDEVKLRVAVRLSDSFRAAPVGVIECEVDVYTRRVRLEKVRM